MRLFALVLSLLSLMLCGCPAKKCDSTSCATGCCDVSGQCQPGDTAASCGTGGQQCASCLGGTCSALKACMFATGGGVGGGGGTGGGATGGGGGGAMRTVTWVRRVTRLQEDGGTALDERLPAGQLGLFVRNGSALMELPGTRTANAYTVPNVPVGDYVIRFGATLVESSVDTLDIGFTDLGRLDVDALDAGAATLHLDVTGLPAWGDLDDVQFFSVGANFYGGGVVAQTMGPTAGMVPTAFEYDYGRLAYFDTSPRVEAAKGDRLWLGFLKWEALITTPVPGAADDGGVLDVPLGCNVLRSTATVGGLNVMAGTNTASASFATAPTTSLGVTWPRTQWDARRSEVHPAAITTGESLYYSAEPLPETASADLISCFNDPRFENPVSDVNRSMTVGNPYPASWAVVGSVQNNYRVTRTVADAGSWSATGSVYVKTPLGQPLVPGIHSPSGVTVQSIAASQLVTVASANPLGVSWLAPVGPPNADDYVVQVLRITKDVNGLQSRATVMTAITRNTSFTFPGGVLATGAIYQVRVRARETGAPADRPFSTPLRSTSEAISNPFLAQ